MPGLRPDVDPDGLLEYSVVYTDRAVNHMSAKFRSVLTDIRSTLRTVYASDEAVIVPGGGTFGMEAVARQFATDCHCVVIRNGWFSYRWSQILEKGSIPSGCTVLKASPTADGSQAPFAPVPVDQAVATIREQRPQVVFAPHVETSCGLLLPDDYLQAVAAATHEHDGLFVLDCIASGAIWVDMKSIDVDVLISAPQKGWSGPPCAALVMLGVRAVERLGSTSSTSFACDLGKWYEIMQAYVNGGHAYHATMPTDALAQFHKVMGECEAFGFSSMRRAQETLGTRVRALLGDRGYPSVAAPGFEAPGVVVCYTGDAAISNGSKFAAQGVQIAAGVPLQCGEPDGFRTFRIGLFGLDKLADIDGTVARLGAALDAID